jgi:serine/threonine-protein kinase RsbW
MNKQTNKLTLPARIENLKNFQDFISAWAQHHSLSQDRIMKLQLASEEALMNIFKYAYPHDAPGDVTVSCSRQGTHDLLIFFEDKGQPFDVLSVEDPDTDLSLDDRNIGGLGIFFIKKMTDDVWYDRKDGKNILTFRISQVPPSPPDT